MTLQLAERRCESCGAALPTTGRRDRRYCGRRLQGCGVGTAQARGAGGYPYPRRQRRDPARAAGGARQRTRRASPRRARRRSRGEGAVAGGFVALGAPLPGQVGDRDVPATTSRTTSWTTPTARLISWPRGGANNLARSRASRPEPAYGCSLRPTCSAARSTACTPLRMAGGTCPACSRKSRTAPTMPSCASFYAARSCASASQRASAA